MKTPLVLESRLLWSLRPPVGKWHGADSSVFQHAKDETIFPTIEFFLFFTVAVRQFIDCLFHLGQVRHVQKSCSPFIRKPWGSIVSHLVDKRFAQTKVVVWILHDVLLVRDRTAMYVKEADEVFQSVLILVSFTSTLWTYFLMWLQAGFTSQSFIRTSVKVRSDAVHEIVCARSLHGTKNVLQPAGLGNVLHKARHPRKPGVRYFTNLSVVHRRLVPRAHKVFLVGSQKHSSCVRT